MYIRIYGENKKKPRKIIDFRTNFCGPYWSDGEFQSSVPDPKLPAVNEFDATCRAHDVSLATAKSARDVQLANNKFYKDNYGRGAVRSIAALLVRYLYPFSYPSDMAKAKGKAQKKNLRGSSDIAQLAQQLAKVTVPKPVKNRPKKASSAYRVFEAPTTVGTSIKGQTSVVNHRGNVTSISGRDIVGTVLQAPHTNWSVGFVHPISPLYSTSSSLGSIARSFRYFRYRRLSFQFVTRQASSAPGEIILSVHPNASKEIVGPLKPNFLQTVMGVKASAMGPLWSNHVVSVPVDAKWREVDGVSNVDIDDNICGELIAFVQSTTTDAAGYILCDYDIEFKELWYNEQSFLMPLPLAEANTQADVLDVNAANSHFTVTLPNVLSPFSNGTVVKMVFDSQQTVFGTQTASINTTASTALAVLNRTVMTTFTVVDGTTMYGVAIGSTLAMYPTLESAISQSDTVYIIYRNVTLTKTNWKFWCYVVQWANATKL